MASNTETGHARNEALFGQLITICQSFGPAYQPANPAITIAKLQDKKADISNAMNNVTAARTDLQNKTNARVILYNDLEPTATRVFNAFKATGASNEAVADMKTWVRKVRGAKAKKAAVLPDGTAAPTRSVSQLSYVNRAEHFENMLSIATQNGYIANDPGIKLPDLQDLLDRMRTANEEVDAAEAAHKAAIISRDAVMYNEDNGASILTRMVKDYVKGAFGASDPRVKQVAAIRYRPVN